jgi:hypothetical protein
MKTHEWKAMGRVIYGSRKTAFFEEKRQILRHELDDASSKSRLCRVTRLQTKSLGPSATKESAIEASVLESNPTLSLRRKGWSDTDRGANVTPAQV